VTINNITTKVGSHIEGCDLRPGDVIRRGTLLTSGRQYPIWVMVSDYPSSDERIFWTMDLRTGHYVQCPMNETYERARRVNIEVEE